ncbi:MAG: hypothetical protein J1F61_04195 [Clostridiales bacterium]|nr:hypothetical protein [Clostridiales bacterium]
MLKISMLAAFTTVQIAVLACVSALCLTLFIVSIIMFALSKKRTKSAEKLYRQKCETPVIIYQTKRIEVLQEAEVPASYVPAEEVFAEEEEYDEVPTVMGEIAAAEAAEAAAKMSFTEENSQNSMRYDRSFRARLIQSDDEVKDWYGIIKNSILAHDKVTSRISWKYESFSYKGTAVAKLFIKGKTLYLYLPLNAADYADSKYKIEDVSDVSQFADTPALYKLKSERRIKYAQELIDEVCKKLGSKKLKIQPVDYYEPNNSDLALINKGLIKRVMIDADKSFIGSSGYTEAQDNDTEFDDKK